MRKRLDLKPGDRYRRLMVLKDVGNNRWGKSQYLCRCDCGTENVIGGSSLISGNTKSCGCLQKETRFKGQNRANLIGQRFERLLVIADADSNKRGESQWLCRCDCGNETIVLGHNLERGSTKSCGCYNKERISETHKNKIITVETRQKMSESSKGEKGSNWKGGISSENDRIRHSLEMQEWRQKVFERDNYTCQICGKRGGKLQAHHIYPFGEYPGRRFRMWNGITLCRKKCHEPIRGKEDQYYEQFLNITLRRPKKIK